MNGQMPVRLTNPGCVDIKPSGMICDPTSGNGFFHHAFFEKCNALTERSKETSPPISSSLVCVDPDLGQTLDVSGPKCVCRFNLNNVRCNDPDGPDGLLVPKFDCNMYCQEVRMKNLGMNLMIKTEGICVGANPRNTSYNCLCNLDFSS